MDFNVQYGDGAQKVDWRRFEESDKDDDEPLTKTPSSVISMLGFDPLHLGDDGPSALDEEEPSVEKRLEQLADMIESARREFSYPMTNREQLRARIKSLEARIQEVRAEARSQARDENGASSITRLAQDFTDWHGIPVRIESTAGSPRSGITPDGQSWSINMPAEYGFIPDVTGADGDDLDVYLGPSPESNNVYVVDQYDLSGSEFDESKCMLGYHTAESAEEDYRLGHHKSDVTFAALTGFTIPQFRRWLKTHDMTQPCSSHVKVRTA